MSELKTHTVHQETDPIFPREFDKVFNLHGKFNNGDTIVKEANMFDALRTLEISTDDIEAIMPSYNQYIQEFDSSLPHLPSYPNALSRDQLVRVLATLKTVTLFNGAPPSDEVDQINNAVYKNTSQNGVARLSDFEKKGAMTCIESSALGQMLLGDDEDIFYVSGSADLEGEGAYEYHTFQVIKTNGSETHPYAVLDLSNPISIVQPDGTIVTTLYCAPITQEQFESFKKNTVINVEYKGVKRAYQYGFGLGSPFSTKWQD